MTALGASPLAGSGSPYAGLQPFGGEDRLFFFGRDEEVQIITINVAAAPMTILYGPSGVGKSSVLNAGVLPRLREEVSRIAVLFHSWQSHDFLGELKQELLRAVQGFRGPSEDRYGLSPELPLDELLLRCGQVVDGPICLVLDQFEEYFFHHPSPDGSQEFEAQLARVVNRRDIEAHILLCVREDALSKLDRFQIRIPNILGNMLRLRGLSREQARKVIEGPLKAYNRRFEEGVSIEPALVDTLINQTSRSQAADEIEAPFLQIALHALWTEERAQGSNALRLATLEKLGGVDRLVQGRVTDSLRRLTAEEADVAARILRYLVTPSGGRIALTTEDLALSTDSSESRISDLLRRLSEERIIRAIADQATVRYEIYHDVLVPELLDWSRRRHVERGPERATSSRIPKWLAGLAALVLVATAAFHASGYGSVVNALTSLPSDSFAREALPGIWLFFSWHLAALAGAAGWAAVRGQPSARPLLTFAAAVACVDTVFVLSLAGIFAGTLLLAAAAGCLVASTWLWEPK